MTNSGADCFPVPGNIFYGVGFWHFAVVDWFGFFVSFCFELWVYCGFFGGFNIIIKIG